MKKKCVPKSRSMCHKFKSVSVQTTLNCTGYPCLEPPKLNNLGRLYTCKVVQLKYKNGAELIATSLSNWPARWYHKAIMHLQWNKTRKYWWHLSNFCIQHTPNGIQSALCKNSSLPKNVKQQHKEQWHYRVHWSYGKVDLALTVENKLGWFGTWPHIVSVNMIPCN